jgi:hypothetical protein
MIPIAHHGIPNVGKMLVIGAVELTQDGRPLRIRLEPLATRAGESVRGFVERLVEPGATLVSDCCHGSIAPSRTSSGG